MFVRQATDDDALDVRRILDAAMLDPGDVEGRTAAGDVLVAGDWVAGSSVRVAGSGSACTAPDDRSVKAPDDASGNRTERERILGTLVLEPREFGAHVLAIGVRRRHRNRGIGRALIEHALSRERSLSARFDTGVEPFYDSLEFSIEPIDDHRFQASRRA